MSLLTFLRPARLAAGLALVLSSAAFNSAQAAVIVNWTGNCITGCSGTASGIVTLVNSYVPGNAVNASDVVQFDFTSDTTNYTGVPPVSIAGGSSLPAGSGSTFFDLADGFYEFTNNADGTWSVAQQIGSNGYNTILTGDTGNFTATPEPSSVLLIGGGLAGLAALRRRKK